MSIQSLTCESPYNFRLGNFTLHEMGNCFTTELLSGGAVKVFCAVIFHPPQWGDFLLEYMDKRWELAGYLNETGQKVACDQGLSMLTTGYFDNKSVIELKNSVLPCNNSLNWPTLPSRLDLELQKPNVTVDFGFSENVTSCLSKNDRQKVQSPSYYQVNNPYAWASYEYANSRIDGNFCQKFKVLHMPEEWERRFEVNCYKGCQIDQTSSETGTTIVCNPVRENGVTFSQATVIFNENEGKVRLDPSEFVTLQRIVYECMPVDNPSCSSDEVAVDKSESKLLRNLEIALPATIAPIVGIVAAIFVKLKCLTAPKRYLPLAIGDNQL